MRRPLFAAAAIAMMGAVHCGGAAAQQAPDLIGLVTSLPGEDKTLVNDPEITALAPYGPGGSWEVVPAKDMFGGQALRVEVPKAGADPWSVGVNAPLTGDIAEGDVVFIAVMARAVDTDGEIGAAGARGLISTFAVQESSGAYERIVEGRADVPVGEWDLFYAWDRADRTLTPETGTIAMHVSPQAQVLEIGPVLVMNLGPDVEEREMPKTR